VNDEARGTDLAVNDGTWHHITVTWQTAEGLWQIYIDGALMDGGSNLRAQQIIDGRRRAQLL